MKKIFLLSVFLLVPLMGFAQMKEQSKLPAFSQVVARPSGNLIFGLIDPSRIDMHHSFSTSFMTGGNNSLMLNTYMNTIDYRISNPLMLRLNLGIMNSPYNTFNNNPGLNNTSFFGGAELMYKPSENTSLRLGVDIAPGYFYNPGYRSGFFDNPD